MSTIAERQRQGWELFAQYAFPPNELGYCGPPDASVLLRSRDPGEIGNHAEGFDGAWAYLQEIADAAGLDDPLDADVVRNYWIGGSLLDQVDPCRLLMRLRTSFAAQPTGLLNDLKDIAAHGTESLVMAHHSFQVLVVYPWVRFLGNDTADPGTPLRILQDCRIRWGRVDSVDDEHVVIESRPLQFVDGMLTLGEPAAETVRWSREGQSLAPRPSPGQTVAAHWDWICGPLDDDERDALAAATGSTLDLVNHSRR